MTSRREREQRRKRYASARERIEALPEIVYPSQFGLEHFLEAIRTKHIPEIALYDRVSGDGQNVFAHLRAAQHRIKSLGTDVLKSFAEEGVGTDLTRPVLQELFCFARRRRIPVVVTAFSRLFRAEAYHPEFRPDERPLLEEMKRLADVIGDVPVCTLNHPDASPLEDREFLKKLSEEGEKLPGRRREQGRKGERQQFKDRWISLAKILHTKGMSCGEIAKEINRRSGAIVSRETIHNWIAETLP